MNERMALGSVALTAILFALAAAGCDSSGATPNCNNPGDCYQEAGPSPIPPDTGAAGAGGSDAGSTDAAKPDTGQPDSAKPDAADAAPADAAAG